MRALSSELDSWEIRTPDLPGHGNSLIDGDLWRLADLLADEFASAHWVGYSLGGRALLHLALAHPEVVESMVLIGASAGFESAADAAARRERDERLAVRLERMSRDDFIRWLNEEWLTQPLFSKLPVEARGVDIRASNVPSSLAMSLRLHGVGSQNYLLPQFSEIPAPTTVIRGEFDNARISKDCELIAHEIPNAHLMTFEGVGHSVPWEETMRFASIVLQRITGNL